jgi:hypothetical protein
MSNTERVLRDKDIVFLVKPKSHRVLVKIDE